MVMRDLREEVMNDVGSDIMVDVVNPPIIPIEGREPTPQVTPFLPDVKSPVKGHQN